jgi:hypothetical protein
MQTTNRKIELAEEALRACVLARRNAEHVGWQKGVHAALGGVEHCIAKLLVLLHAEQEELRNQNYAR